MRVLMISKACLVGTYQSKLEGIACFPDVDLTVIVPPSWRDGTGVLALEKVHTSGYQLLVEPIVLNGSFHAHFYPGLGRRLRDLQPDIVHIDEEPYNFATFHALWLARRFGARSIWFSWQNLNRRYPGIFRLIEQYNLQNTHYAIAGSKGAAKVWQEKGYRGPLAVIPQFGVDPDLFVPGKAGTSSTCPTIGYVGRLVPEKGVDLLVEAVSQMEQDFHLIIVGDGPERTRLLAVANSTGIANRVSFAGRLPSMDLPAFYHSLDILVLPSRSRPNWVEQFGRVLIEAMACGVAVVGSDCGEIPGVVGDAGLIFEEGNVEDLRDQLSRLACNLSLRADLARRGRERVLAHFTQAAVAARTVDVYRDVMRNA